MTATVGNCPDTWIPESAREWHGWLLREEEATVRAYREKPSNLIADYHRERAIARDYEGREILELLQNANDQAAEIKQPGRVFCRGCCITPDQPPQPETPSETALHRE